MVTAQETMIDGWELEGLILKVQAGETEVYARIVEVFQQPIYRYCCRLLGNRQDAEDAVQDILVKAYQSLRRYKPDVSFSAWLYRIACNHCLNLLRRRRLQGRVLRVLRPETAAAGPEQELEARLYSPQLAAALCRLSLEERNLLVLRVFEELTFLEISQILHVSPNALHKRMERIKGKVREAMHNEEGIVWEERESALSTKI
ncbi:RNA polymerase sigma factor [Paenibacillus tepidiphilus]|uniref:RNA polymerase sigma factor n=1 Tax=Paenibacillus tepidiphilus TaxID=2608683 RepID=UPI00123B2F2E|nr:sigma-70 family RNA polymerase sigma factor [Paenibacillus tepidiphilus]